MCFKPILAPQPLSRTKTVDLIAERLTYERILRAIETAFAVADKYQNLWAHEEIERDLRRHDVLGLWVLWRAANHEQGLTMHGHDTHWFRLAVNHTWVGGDGRE